MNRLTRLLPASAALIALMAVMALPAQANPGDLYVADTGSDLGNNCTAAATPCLTIQHAVNEAVAGDTIHVAAGTYPEPATGPLTIDKTLTLLGAQAGADARGRVAAESTVTDSQGTYVTANKVVIDGFSVQGSTLSAFTGYGIAMGAGTTGTQILNNVIQNNIAGIGLVNSGSSQVLIQHNQIQNNNQSGGASGTGIYTDQYVSRGAVKNVLIEENAFVGNDDAGIDISNTDPANGVSSLDISTNTFDANGRGLVLFNTHTSTIHGNTITNSTLVGSAAIRIFDDNSDLSIIDNDLSIGTGHAIRFSVVAGLGPSSGVVINENNIGTVGSTSFALDGLLVDSGSHVGTVNAECNWWGSTTGPTNTNNPGGTGEEVVGDADFTPWLIATAPGGACLGGVPSTPGKVTGGGQVQGDPVFSLDGVLLSVPALVPSSADPKSQASFGFVVQSGGGTTTGNLEYDDKPAAVRIKATSISTLFISSGSCGANTHVQFSGTAAVTRSTGTTTQSFTAQADDCGEPGTMDKFGITTAGYSNGPSILIGGNIQIHKQ
jgi:hypothetical protein